MTDLQNINDLLDEHAACVATIEQATKRKTAIELRLSTIKEALSRLDTQGFGVPRKPRGRPRKVPNIDPEHIAERLISNFYDSPASVEDEDFGGNAAK